MVHGRAGRALARSFKKLAVAASISLATTVGAHAAVIAGAANDTLGSGFGVGFSFDPSVNLVIAQGFDVAAPATIGSVTVYLNDDNPTNGADSFTLYITRAIGAAATPADVLATLSGTFPLTPPGVGAHFPVTFSGLSIPVAPVAATLNDYFLVVASSGGPDTGWGTDGTPISGVGDAFVGIVIGGGVGDYTTPDPASPNTSHTNFLVETAPAAAAPEPGSLALLGIGLGAFAFSRRRQRR